MNDFATASDKHIIPMNPPNVFHFRAPNDNTLNEIENGYVFFQTRTKLNDKLDSNPEFVELNDESSELSLLRETLIKPHRRSKI